MLDSTTKRYISLILSLVLFFASILVIATLDKPAALDAIQARTNKETLQQEYNRQKGLVDSAQAILQTYDNLGNLVQGFSTVLPTTVQYGELTDTLTGLATKDGLHIATINFSPGTVSASPDPNLPTKGYGTIVVNLSLDGPYQSFWTFTKDLEANMRLLDVRNVQVLQSQGGSLRYQVSLAAYYQS
ncbi:MAG: type 4a pilus biogenesis protein PilO [Patescibacteria group bacterium]|nr:type 4a pilus biogenesis protein PilO [Patescibacteria group bacterium]MDE2438115.1 type 4a pilus biogenesis protein PilO [Patescibacteria group bacterium]